MVATLLSLNVEATRQAKVAKGLLGHELQRNYESQQDITRAYTARNRVNAIGDSSFNNSKICR